MAERTRVQRWTTIILAVIAIALLTANWFRDIPDAWKAPPTARETTQTSPTVPLDENVYYPEGRSITDCTGFVERPGCGSEARGGQAQTVLFVALMGAIGFIGWRIFRGVRRQPS